MSAPPCIDCDKPSFTGFEHPAGPLCIPCIDRRTRDETGEGECEHCGKYCEELERDHFGEWVCPDCEW